MFSRNGGALLYFPKHLIPTSCQHQCSICATRTEIPAVEAVWNVSSISEATHLNIDSRTKSSILSIGDNAPWVPIGQSGEKFEVYGYRGKQDPPEILERVTYAATCDIPTGGTIILACHNGLGRKNRGNVLLLPTFILRE